MRFESRLETVLIFLGPTFAPLIVGYANKKEGLPSPFRRGAGGGVLFLSKIERERGAKPFVRRGRDAQVEALRRHFNPFLVFGCNTNESREKT